jgi:activator of HSP90 ATPase
MVWRTSDFGELENSATVTVEFVADDAGTLVTLTQTNTPASQGDRYVAGWKDFYFTPMAAYFV